MDNDTAGVDPTWIAGTDFIQLHLDLVDALDGDFHAALLLDRIKFRAGSGWWTATLEEMQAATRLSEWQLRKATNKLRELGYIESERISAYNPIMRWRVVIAANTVNEESSITTSSDPQSQNEESSITREREPRSLPLSKNSKELLDKKPPISPTAFDEFWTAYPRKKGKGQARTAWVKAVKKVDPAVIVAAAVQFRQWCQQDGTEPQFIAHPSTWLNGERWLDERDAPTDKMQGHIALIAELWENETVDNPQKQLEG